MTCANKNDAGALDACTQKSFVFYVMSLPNLRGKRDYKKTKTKTKQNHPYHHTLRCQANFPLGYFVQGLCGSFVIEHNIIY